MSPIGLNITRLMRERGLSLPKLAMRAGVDKGNLHRIIQEGTGYSSASLGRLAEALDVSIAALFAEGSNVEPVPTGFRRVPLLSTIQAGAFTGVFIDGGEMLEYVLTTANCSEKSFFMRVKGDSMVPDVQEGQLVLVDPDAELLPGRLVVAVNGDGEAMLKRYAERGVDAAGQTIFELIPSNPYYSTLRSDQNDIKIKGVVREIHIRLF